MRVEPAVVAAPLTPARWDAGWLIAWAIFTDVLLVPLHLIAPGAPGLVIALALAGLVFFAWLARSPGLSPSRVSWVVVAWSVFTAFAAASLLWSPNREYGAWKLALLVALGLAPSLMARTLVASDHSFSWRPAAWWAVAYLAIAALTSHEAPEYPGRMTLPGGNPIWLGRSAIIASALVWQSQGWPILVRAALAGAGGYLAIASGSRGPLAAAVILIALLGARGAVRAMWRGRMSRRLLAAPALGVALVVFAVGIGASSLRERMAGNRIVASLDVGELGRDENVLSRRLSFAAGLTEFVAHPGLGVGLGGLAPSGLREYPHNLLVEVSAELGIVGMLFLGLAIWASIRPRRGDGTGGFLLAFCGLCALVSGDLGTNATLVAIALAPPTRSGKGSR